MVGILQNETPCYRRTQGAGSVPATKSDTSIASRASTNESSSSESSCSVNPSEGNTSESPQNGPDLQAETTAKESEEVSSSSTIVASTKASSTSNDSPREEEDGININDASVLRRCVSESAAAQSSTSESSCSGSGSGSGTLEQSGTSVADDGASNAFPSLPTSVLRQLGLLVRSDREAFTETDIEQRFMSLALAFKTDVLTLSSRLELQKRQRDQAEINMASEAAKLKTSLYNLSRVYIDSDCVEALAQIQLQVDILQQATNRVSGSAEHFGAVQQEHRLSRATEVLVAHVENTKLTVEKMNGQLEELKRVLAENNIVMEDNPDGDEPAPRTLRYRSLAAITAKKLNAKRRASIAALPRPVAASLEAGRSLANLLEPRPKSHMANIVNSMRMKSTLSTITALASSTVDISEWQEKAEEAVQIEKVEPTESKSEASADSSSVAPEVNNNEKEVDEADHEVIPEVRVPVLTPCWRESRHYVDDLVYEEPISPMQYLRDGWQRLVVENKQAAITYVQRNKSELLKKIRFYIASALFAVAGWFIIWTIIPTSDASPYSPLIRW